MPSVADLDAYLGRLGVDAEPPSSHALFRLHRAHVERIVYENLWIHLGENWGVDPEESLHRIASTHRGGYCFHLNGAFAALLTALGYTVSRHVGGVHGPNGPHADELGNHVALVVSDLPSAVSPDGRWYVDAGLGDSLYEPMPLRAGVSVQGDTRFELCPTDSGWHLSVGPGASITGVEIVDRSVPMAAFADRNTYFRTSPESPFARTVTAQRRYAAGTAVLRGCVLTRTEGDLVTTQVFDTLDDWLGLVDAEFGLRLDVPVNGLWATIRAAHDAWVADQASGST